MKDMNQYSFKIWSVFVLLSGLLLMIPWGMAGNALWNNLFSILTDPGVLITDYLSVGELAATLFNVFALMVINVALMMLIKQPFNGPVIAALLTIAGFAFFGKSMINFIPIYLGIFIYAKWMKNPLNQYSVVMLFSSALGPLVSYLWFGIEGPLVLRLVLGTLVGILAGMMTPLLSIQARKVHQGLNLYNVGFTLGIISTFFALGIRSLGFSTASTTSLSIGFDTPLWILNGVLIAGLLIAGFLSPKSSQTFKALLESGGIGEDFFALFGLKNTLFNMAGLGVLALIVMLIFGFPMNGPVMASIWTLIGFGAYGKHLKNSGPLMVGVILAALIGIAPLDSVVTIIAIFFVTALAPVTGRYGVVMGVLAGMLHLTLLPVAYQIQGGFDLYNNGFSAGFVGYFVILTARALEKMKLLKVKTT
jgi:hypothetical protein